MDAESRRRFPLSSNFLVLGLVLLLALFALFLVFAIARASTPLGISGYFDFNYGATLGDSVGPPTAEKPESKLWWNDGYWWGILYNQEVGEYRIYRLNWGMQTWEDTGVTLDERLESRADVLWDETNQKLYVASHFKQENPSPVSGSANWARLYRFSYDEDSDSYVPDTLGGDPYVTVNEDKTETLVMDKDSSDRLWVTYISRPQGTSDYQVYVNASTATGLAGDASWEDPFSLGDVIPEAHVDVEDIASLISFGDHVGVMWSRQISGTAPISYTLNFAVHPNGSAYNADWTHHSVDLPLGADDHINLKSVQVNSAGQVFAAVKLEPDGAAGSEPLVGVVARDTNGEFSFHTYSNVTNQDTRPILLIDEEAEKLYMFVTGKPGGSKTCYKTLDIVSPLEDMGDFVPAGDCGISFIEDGQNSTYLDIDNATSTKQNVNSTTGIVVLASDNVQYAYVHNVLGNPPPVITARSPDQGDVDVPVDSLVQVTFSKPMNAGTLTATGNFTVQESGVPVAGTITYDDTTRTATFTPDLPFKANANFDVTVTNGVEDTGNQALFETETWSFTTAQPTVQFSSTNYSVNEAVLSGTATITVTLNTESATNVSVNYATSADTATSGSDYTDVSDTLTFAPGETSKSFNVPILDDLDEEGNETVNLTLDTPVMATLGAPAIAVLTIIDDEGPLTVQFEPTSYFVNEDVGNATINVTLSRASSGAVTVDYATSDGTATAGEDYASVSDTLTFAAGETTKTFIVPITDDAADEMDETINLALSAPTGGATLNLTDATGQITILDNDLVPSVGFSSSTYSVDEDGGSVSIAVQLSAASAKAVTVDYASSLGTALPGVDYTEVSGQLTFAPGETNKTFNVPILDDKLDEGDEKFNLTLSNPSNASLSTSSALVTILDNDEVIYLPLILK